MPSVDDLAQPIKDQIDRLIGDKSIGWETLCEVLEEIEDHAGEWSRQIRSEHE